MEKHIVPEMVGSNKAELLLGDDLDDNSNPHLVLPLGL
jgi:hypothetical protein